MEDDLYICLTSWLQYVFLTTGGQQSIVENIIVHGKDKRSHSGLMKGFGRETVMSAKIRSEKYQTSNVLKH